MEVRSWPILVGLIRQQDGNNGTLNQYHKTREQRGRSGLLSGKRWETSGVGVQIMGWLGTDLEK